MSKICEIKFDDNSYGVYFPGQTLSGSVELNFEEAMKVKGVALQIKGEAKVSWTEYHSNGQSHYPVYFQNRQDYMNFTENLAGYKDGNNIDLLPGIHTYRFSYVLPLNLDSSLEAEHGHIRYTVKVILERPWKVDHSYKVAFTVLRHVNLNENNFNVCLPVEMEKSKTFCCGPCSSAPMVLKAETPISGYVSGQTIVVKIEVDNRSKKNLEELIIKLLCVMTYTSKSPYTKVKTVSATMAKVRCAGVKKQKRGSYVQHLYIPSLPPTSNTCPIIMVDYFVEVEGKIANPTINPKIQIPITLGTIPLTPSAIPTFENITSKADPIMVPPMASASDPQAPNFLADLPPPSYEEVFNGTGINIRDEKENTEVDSKEYIPRYMVYQFDEKVVPEPLKSGNVVSAAQFILGSVTKDEFKFYHIVAKVDQSVTCHIADLVSNPPQQEKYKAVKDRLIARYALSPEARLERLLGSTDLGDVRPTDLSAKMQELATGLNTNDNLLKMLFVQRMPPHV
ncbi:arrestin domain-containing protein 3-like [Ochlerotatus camptorhynchus]|uniref:arrestin domain-containing protein 3-like n=1 Tax=Ochlerotatus camptorhynchus TaxID=644619 RepID=UPI0031D12177